MHLGLVDHQGWSEANDITVRGLGQQAVLLELDADIPSVVFCGEGRDESVKLSDEGTLFGGVRGQELT